MLTIRFHYFSNKKNYLAGWYLYGTYTVTIKHVIFRSSFTCSTTPRGLKKLLLEIESHLPEFLKLP